MKVKSNQENLKDIDASAFEGEIEGQETSLYTIVNENGIEATFTNYGQRLVSLFVPDREGAKEDIVLGFSSLEEYYNSKGNFYGATIGRYGNRIANGKFSLNNNEYVLEKNNGENNLHGGTGGFHNVVWAAEKPAPNRVVFSRTSPNMEEGFPGNLDVRVEYTLTSNNELEIKYNATTNKTTVVNLTHHSFFNLAGAGNGNIGQHILAINADKFTPVDEGMIPTGELADVEGTPFDFTSPKPIGTNINSENEQLKFGNGYDHNFVLNEKPKNEEGLVLAARVREPKSGRTMEVFTDEPGLQFYTGNWIDENETGKGGKVYERRGAFCLETQHFPNSPNQPNFPGVSLKPGQEYTSTCVYKFGTGK